MKAFIEEYGVLIAEFLVALALIVVLFTSTIGNNDAKDKALPQLLSVSAGDNGMLAAMGKPLLEVNHATIQQGQPFNPAEYIVRAEDAQGGDLKSFVQVDYSDVDVNTVGIYEAHYKVEDSNGLVTKTTIQVKVTKETPTLDTNPT